MCAFVTGETGLIGANLVRLLLAQDPQVCALVRPHSLNLEIELLKDSGYQGIQKIHQNSPTPSKKKN